MQKIFENIYNLPLEQVVVLLLLVFCRIAACLMTMPAFSSSRLPVKIRLFTALSLAFAVSPLVEREFYPLLDKLDFVNLFILIFSESAVGLVIGLSSQVFFSVLQFVTATITLSLGYSPQATFGINNNQESSLGDLISMTLLILFFISNLHLMVFNGLVGSYHVIKPCFAIKSDMLLNNYINDLIAAFNIILRIAMPFVVYAIAINFAVGVLNKLTPMIPVYFISTIIVLYLGLFLFYMFFPHFISYFNLELTDWIGEHN